MSKKMFSGFVIASAILYAFSLIYVLFLGFGRGNIVRPEHMRFGHAMNLIPFKTIAEYCAALIDGDRVGAIMNLTGNLLLLMPLGFFLPFFIQKAAKLKVYVPVVSALIIVIEVAQLITMRGSCDIDDFLLNLSGALIGLAICKRVQLRSLFMPRAYYALRADIIIEPAA
jgi:glycopeptide antibiotics resistance protein